MPLRDFNALVDAMNRDARRQQRDGSGPAPSARRPRIS